jgi:Zn-dependent protease with chaperone function
MLEASVALAALAVLLAWPVPELLSGARWTRRSPAVALALWQSIALAGGLSMIGALLTFGLDPFGHDLVGSAIGFLRLTETPEPWHVVALSAALLLSIHLVFNLVATLVRSERQRRRHAQLVTLLSSPMESGARLIDSPTPVAYCLPGPFSSITVYSAGLVELLEPDELEAVIAHERAHVVQRHDIVLIAFRAWHASLPWFPITYRAQREVGLLIEMLADDRARKTVSTRSLARAIAAVGAGGPIAGETATPADLSERILRLDGRHLPLAAEALVVGLAAALLGFPTALLFAPAVLALLSP